MILIPIFVSMLSLSMISKFQSFSWRVIVVHWYSLTCLHFGMIHSHFFHFFINLLCINLIHLHHLCYSTSFNCFFILTHPFELFHLFIFNLALFPSSSHLCFWAVFLTTVVFDIPTNQFTGLIRLKSNGKNRETLMGRNLLLNPAAGVGLFALVPTEGGDGN